MESENQELISSRRLRNTLRSLFVMSALALIPYMGLRYFNAVTNFLLDGQHEALQLYSKTVAFQLTDRLNFNESNPISAEFLQRGTRIWILDKDKRVRYVVGTLQNPLAVQQKKDQSWMTHFLEKTVELITRQQVFPESPISDYSDQLTHRTEPFINDVLSGEHIRSIRPSLDQQNQILMAADPIWINNQVAGVLLTEQSSESIIAQNRRSLLSLATVTLLVFLTLITFILGIAWRVTRRINKLQTATERSITRDGRVVLDYVPQNVDASDEIEDLQNAIANMLRRLHQYHRYLEEMPDTLAHEMSNPLNVVQSSLHNLEQNDKKLANNQFMERAHEGIQRLQGLLTRLTEAASLEDAISPDDLESLDIVSMMEQLADGYRYAHPEKEMQLISPDTPLYINGSPEHIAQMFDKLVDNAIEYAKADTPIILSVRHSTQHVHISVINQGNPLPEGDTERLFEPMVSLSKQSGRSSHLGLGLYVVKIIAGFHGATVQARNRRDGDGVAMTVSFPLNRAKLTKITATNPPKQVGSNKAA